MERDRAWWNLRQPAEILRDQRIGVDLVGREVQQPANLPQMNAADWMFMATLADDANMILDYEPTGYFEQIAGGSPASRMQEWVENLLYLRRVWYNQTWDWGEVEGFRYAADRAMGTGVAFIFCYSQLMTSASMLFASTKVDNANVTSAISNEARYVWNTHIIQLLSAKNPGEYDPFWDSPDPMGAAKVDFQVWTWGATWDVVETENRLKCDVWGYLIGDEELG